MQDDTDPTVVEEAFNQEVGRKPNRAERRLLASNRYRARVGLPKMNKMGNEVQRKLPDAQYDEETDHLIFYHPTKGRRRMSRKRFELRAKMQALLSRPAADDGARV